MTTIMFLATIGVIVGIVMAFLMRKMPTPPAHVLVPVLLLGIVLLAIVVWFQIRSAVELPSFLKK